MSTDHPTIDDLLAACIEHGWGVVLFGSRVGDRPWSVELWWESGGLTRTGSTPLAALIAAVGSARGIMEAARREPRINASLTIIAKRESDQR